MLLGAGIGVGSRSLKRALFGWKRYPGSVEAICRAVLDDCWRGTFLAGSAGHFRQFWTRDLAMCTPALCRLGLRDRVVQSWEWGLRRFEAAGRITTTIFARRFPRDVYAYACDSLPMLLFALEAAGAEHLIQRHHALLSREVVRFYETVFDPELGLARPDGYFSGPRDCMNGVWQAMEVAPAPCFSCGDLFCQTNAQYCEVTAGSGATASFRCGDTPAACRTAATCACLVSEGVTTSGNCGEEGTGQLLVVVDAP